MPITRETELLAEGTYNVGSRKAAPQGLAMLRNGVSYTLHHILPYRYMCFIGYLAEIYRDQLLNVPQQDQAGWPENRQDDVSKKVALLFATVCPFGGQQQDVRTRFAWMAANLFQGPSGNYRIDDPGSEREQTKPHSLTISVWTALGQLETALDVKVTAWGSGANNTYTATTKKWTVGSYIDLLKHTDSLIQRGHGNALGFTDTDWIVLESEDQRDRIPQDRAPSDYLKAQYRNLDAGNLRVIRYRPVFTTVNPSPVGPKDLPNAVVLWRLRKANEAVPATKYHGKFKIQPQ